MSLDLRIYPLSDVENLVHQKCLLHKDRFPKNTRVGCWAQCYFRINNNTQTSYSICQLYPRDEGEINVGYLDTSVCDLEYAITGYNYCKLSKVNVLTSCKIKTIEEVHVTVQLMPQFFIDNAFSVNRIYLKNIVQTLLQGYHLFNNCWVRNIEFLKCGIDCVKVEIDDAEELFILNEDSKIIIKDITLEHTQMLSKDMPLIKLGTFMKPRQQLDELMTLMKMQRNGKISQHLRIPLNVLLIGSMGCGKTSLIETFFKDHACNVFRIYPANILKPYPGETEQEIRKIFQAASHFEQNLKPAKPTVIVLEELHVLCPYLKSDKSNDSNMSRVITELFKQIENLCHEGLSVMCLASTSCPEAISNLIRRAGRFEREITINSLTEEERQECIWKLFKKNLPSVENLSNALVELMAKLTQGYTLADLNLLTRNIIRDILRQSEHNLELLIKQNLLKLNPICLNVTEITAYKTTKSFTSIGGMHDLKRILNISILAGMKRPESFLRLGLSLPKGILLYGPPGCAKTTIAQCLATEANMTFICTSAAEVYSPYVGCAEKFISKIFDTARKNAPCLIFLDEIDSLVGRRSFISDNSADNVQLRILSTLLTEMDGIVSGDRITHNTYNYLLVVAATNRPDLIDDALLRPGRFDKLIHIPVPDLSTRLGIFQLQAKQIPFSEKLHLNDLAERTANYSGADICNLCNEAALQAFQRDCNTNVVLLEDFNVALHKVKSSLSQQQINWYYEFDEKCKTC